MPVRTRKLIGRSAPLVWMAVASARPADFDAAGASLARSAEERDEAHRDPGEPKADQRYGRRLVRGVLAEMLEVRAEGRSRQIEGERELADDDRQRQEGPG